MRNDLNAEGDKNKGEKTAMNMRNGPTNQPNQPKIHMNIPIDPQLMGSVKGFLDEEEGRCLYETALEAGPLGPCLEIGSYCGKSALYIGAACHENDTVLFSVDHHHGSEEQQPGEEYFDHSLFDAASGRVDTFHEFRSTIERADLEDAVVPIVCRSEIVARKWATALSLVFIDGGHAFETVLSDYTAWSPHVIEGGYLLIHDIFSDPTQGGQAPYRVYQHAVNSGLFREVSMVKTLGVLKRVKSSS